MNTPVISGNQCGKAALIAFREACLACMSPSLSLFCWISSAEVDVLITRGGWMRLPDGRSESFRPSVAFRRVAAILVRRSGSMRLLYLPAGRIAILLRFSEKSRPYLTRRIIFYRPYNSNTTVLIIVYCIKKSRPKMRFLNNTTAS